MGALKVALTALVLSGLVVVLVAPWRGIVVDTWADRVIKAVGLVAALSSASAILIMLWM